MKSIIQTSSVLLVLVAMLVVCRSQPHIEQPPPPVIVKSQGPTIERLERLSGLVTSRVRVVDVLIGESDVCRGAWLIKGDALIAIDLNHAQITDKSEDSKKAVITLPQPEVLQARVDHEKTRTWEVRTTTWIPWHADQDRLRDEVMLQAQRLVAQAAGSKENIEQAKRAAEIVISALYEQVGWDVKVTWQETPPAQVSSEATAVTAGTCQR